MVKIDHLSRQTKLVYASPNYTTEQKSIIIYEDQVLRAKIPARWDIPKIVRDTFRIYNQGLRSRPWSDHLSALVKTIPDILVAPKTEHDWFKAQLQLLQIQRSLNHELIRQRIASRPVRHPLPGKFRAVFPVKALRITPCPQPDLLSPEEYSTSP